MYLTILDLILILSLFLFVAFGFVLGFIQSVGALVGVVIGAWLAGIYYEPIGAWLEPFLLGHGNWSRTIAFILIFVLINRLTGLLFWIVNKVYNVVSIIPFTKTINRLLGALLGLTEGVLVLGLILYFVARFNFSDWFTGVLAGSKVAVWLSQMANILVPLLPEVLRQLKSVI